MWKPASVNPYEDKELCCKLFKGDSILEHLKSITQKAYNESGIWILNYPQLGTSGPVCVDLRERIVFKESSSIQGCWVIWLWILSCFLHCPDFFLLGSGAIFKIGSKLRKLLESKERGLEMVELRWRWPFPERKRGIGVLWSGNQIRDFWPQISGLTSSATQINLPEPNIFITCKRGIMVSTVQWC